MNTVLDKSRKRLHMRFPGFKMKALTFSYDDGVIFDKKYGVQFSPVLDGSIYNTPTESCILAAKISLEGYKINGKVLFFLAPKYAQSSWIPNSRTYEFTVGKHDFYS